MIITISGTAGSGKSTVAKIIAKKLKFKHMSVGNIRRKIAKEKGMTIEELNEYAKTHPETDVDVDKDVAKRARKLKNVIVEGRTQFYFLPESKKIYLKVSPRFAAKRIFNDLQDKEKKIIRNQKEVKNIQELEKLIIKRDENDKERYQKYYNLDHTDESHYDLVLDTSKMTIQEVVKKVMDFINS